MSDTAINPVTRRVQFTGNTGTGPFAFTFNILTDGDIAVYKNTTALTLTADYSVTINVNGTGSVTLVAALVSTDVLTIIGGRQLARTTDFVTAGDLLATSLNEQLDSNVIMAQQLDEKLGRGLYVNPGDVYTDLELPLKDARKGTVLGFNATTGDPEPGPEIGDVDSLAAISGDIKTLAEIQDGTVATGAITTAAANITEIQNAPANAAIATTKAGEAAVSATAAEAAFDSFDDRYLGSKTANPTVDNDGNALVAGALYFNTTVSLMKVYTGSAWYTVGGPFVELSGGNMTGNLTFGDSDAIFMGAGNDLTIFHNGTDSYIQDQGTGNLIIGSDGASISIHDFVGSQDMAKFTIGGSAELYHNGVKKIETTATGVDVTGNIVVSGNVDGRDVAADGTKLDYITVTQAVSLDQMEIDIAALANGMVYKGDWDASASTFPGSGSAQVGWFYYVSVAGTVGGISFAVGDNIVAIVNNASTSTYASNWSKHDQTDAVTSVVGLNGSITKSGLLSALNVEDGADVTGASNVTAAGALMDSEVTNLAQVKAFSSADYATAAQGTLATNALPKAGGALTGAVTTNSTFDGRDVATDGGKLDTIATSANNYVHPNHTGEVTSTGDGATVITDNVVDEANLKVSNTPTNGYFLSAQSGNTGGLTWATVPAGYTDADVDTHLNKSTATTGEVLSWSGTDYDWIAAGGGGADLYAANESSPSAQPSATGANAIAIGDSSLSSGISSFSGPKSRAAGADSVAFGVSTNNISTGASNTGGVAIGRYAYSTGTDSISLGKTATSTSTQALALGFEATASNTQAVAIQASRATGTNSLAIQTEGPLNYGATGSYSIAIGRRAQSNSSYAVSIGGFGTIAGSWAALSLGYESSANGSYATVLGNRSTATAQSAVSIGTYAKSSIQGKLAYSGERFSATGDSQTGTFVLRCDTTDATPEKLQTTSGTQTVGTTNQVILPNNSAYFFSGTIIAREQASAGTDVGAWEIKGAIRREANAASTVLIKSTIDDFNVPTGWAVALTADTTNGGLAITVTGAAATNIRWVATVNTSEVTY